MIHVVDFGIKGVSKSTVFFLSFRKEQKIIIQSSRDKEIHFK